ncbi:hypothetical protein OAO87_03100 [bacterium]|nr:hypothetical protein [bacterium]
MASVRNAASIDYVLLVDAPCEFLGGHYCGANTSARWHGLGGLRLANDIDCFIPYGCAYNAPHEEQLVAWKVRKAVETCVESLLPATLPTRNGKQTRNGKRLSTGSSADALTVRNGVPPPPRPAFSSPDPLPYGWCRIM